jgi:hypothetical protein
MNRMYVFIAQKGKNGSPLSWPAQHTRPNDSGEARLFGLEERGF